MSGLDTTQRQAAEALVALIGRQEVPDDGTLARGDSIARYTVLEPIGRGGLGDVYRVYDPKLDRCVALKLIRSGYADRDDAAKRLEREARALAALDHPNVVTVFDFGVDAGRLFVAMECIEGRTLRQWASESPRSWQEIRDVYLEAGNGLDAAHRAGLVHRDFKPENVLIDRAEDRVRVVDFGLARSATGATATPTTVAPVSRLDVVTPHGSVVGTPRYMSPEQLQGAAVDARSDQFAFCVALFEALYGEWPFDRDAPQSRALVKTGNSLSVPPWIRRALARGLSEDPNDRHPSMAALLQALVADRRSRRRRWWSALTSAGVGAVLAAVAILGPAELTDDEASQLDAMEGLARKAALEGRFVYPGRNEEGGSALEIVLALERSEIPSADERAAGLRAEFADRLVALGDELDEVPNGNAFASDYYAAALVFDPDRASARRGTALTPGEVAMLRDQATQGEFSPRELAAGEVLAKLASEGAEPLEERVRDVLQDAEAPRGRSAKRTMPDQPSPPPADEADDIEIVAEPTAAVDEEPAMPKPPPPAKTPKDRPRDASEPAPTKVDAGGHAAALAAGRAALSRAAFAEAEKHFHRALAASPGSAPALSGLAEVHFDRYEYGEAKKYAKRATNAAPNGARYWVQLGDAHYKLSDYRAARTAWDEAVRLGSDRAKGRLEKLQRRLGSSTTAQPSGK